MIDTIRTCRNNLQSPAADLVLGKTESEHEQLNGGTKTFDNVLIGHPFFSSYTVTAGTFRTPFTSARIEQSYRRAGGEEVSAPASAYAEA